MVPQWFVEKYEYRLKECYMCAKPITQKKRGRPRLTCSDACKEARHRTLNGKPPKRFKKLGKLVEARRALPFIERLSGSMLHEPVAELSYKRWAYECVACGETYIVDRIKSGAPIREYCSDKCQSKSRYHWLQFGEAMVKAHLYRTPIDKRVFERETYGKLSPLCPCCGKPFAPNTTLYGQRKRGRPRKYCSDYCRKMAYEKRWKRRAGRSRRHRMHPCAECGTMFDRTDSMGRRTKRFCKKNCEWLFMLHAQRARKKKLKVSGKQIRGWRDATLRAKKNREKRANKGDLSISVSTNEFQRRGSKSIFSNENDGLASWGEVGSGA